MDRLDEQLKRIKELLGEQHGGEGGVPAGGGGTSTNSSGQYMSAHAWQQGGILTKDGRKDDIGEKPVEVDITQDSKTVTLTVDDVMGDDPAGEIVDVLDDLLINPHSQGVDFNPQSGELPYGDDPHGDHGHGDDRDPVDDGPGDPSGDDDVVIPGGHGCPCEAWQLEDLNSTGAGPGWGNVYHPACCPEGEGSPDGINKKLGGTPCCEPCEEKKGWWRRCHDEREDACKYATISDCELANKEGESNLDSLSLSDIWGTE